MQPDIVFPARDAVETVEPAHGIVALENTNALPEMRQPDAGGETRHAGANDGDVIVRCGVHSGVSARQPRHEAGRTGAIMETSGAGGLSSTDKKAGTNPGLG